MREHEVPTHVQAEDRVLLGFTFPQVVAVTAVCAISYGAYRYAPVGPSEVRMALAADLLKYRLGARRYAGQTTQLVRSEPPAPAQPVKTGSDPIRLMVRKARLSQAAQEDPQEQGAAQRTDALVREAQR